MKKLDAKELESVNGGLSKPVYTDYVDNFFLKVLDGEIELSDRDLGYECCKIKADACTCTTGSNDGKDFRRSQVAYSVADYIIHRKYDMARKKLEENKYLMD